MIGKPGTKWCSPSENPGMRLYGFGMMLEPLGNSPIFSRCGVVSPSKRARISRSASGCSSSGTPAAADAHCRVWSSGVAPMPPKLNTTSAPAMVRRRVEVMSAGSSPRYSHHARRSPRAARISTLFAKCLSCRFPRMISSPMIISPKPMSACPSRRGAQLRQASEAIVDVCEAGVYRHEEPDDRYVPRQCEHDPEQEQVAAPAAHDLRDLGRARVLRESVVAEHALVEVAEEQQLQERPKRRREP